MTTHEQPTQETDDTTDSDGQTAGAVVVRHYGLLQPMDWGPDIDDELRRMNRLWNTLVEIDNYAHDQYFAIIGASQAMGTIGQEIAALEAKRETLFGERRARYARARGKVGVDTSDIDVQIQETRAALHPLYAERKKRTAAAKAECAEALAALEVERKAFVKSARQNCGAYWGNYNAVIASYQRARVRAMKDGALLRFHSWDGTGRLVNQIQGGMSIEDLYAGRHSQVSLRPLPPGSGRATHYLTITVFTGRDASGDRFRRRVSFPIVLHRVFPPGAIIKEVAVQIDSDAAGRTVRAKDLPEDRHGARRASRVRSNYHVTFTCRAANSGELASGTAGAGVNLGWKQVRDGLRVATAAYGAGVIEDLVLPQAWLDGMARTKAMQSELDDGLNQILPVFKAALAGLPRPDGSVSVERVPESWHRRLYALSVAPKYGIPKLLELALDLRLTWETEPTALPMLHECADQIEAWRRAAKTTFVQMGHIRERMRAQRKDLYRRWAKRLVDRAGLIAIDATSYKEAARTRAPQTDEKTKLSDTARTNRVLAAPYELRLSIEQAAAKRGAHIERYAGKINICDHCGGRLHGALDDVYRTCQTCGAVCDIDHTAALNLLAEALAAPARAVG